MSSLKKFLLNRGFDVKILYWNLKIAELQNKFLWGLNIDDNYELSSTLIFHNYLAVKIKDKEAIAKIKAILMALKPQYLSTDPSLFDKHMLFYANELDSFITAELNKIDFSEILVWGFSVNLYQWIGSSIIARKIKEIAFNCHIVIGGIGTKESASAFISSFIQFDYAIWGEGEYILSELADIIANNKLIEKEKIGNIVYREGDSIITSAKRNNKYTDLDDTTLFPDYDDYFEQLLPQQRKKNLMLHIEGSRGCHWKKCHFCYLNTGYRNRKKKAITISKQIQLLIERYHIYDYAFLDNDIICDDWDRFEELLVELSKVKNLYPKFQIILAEIITYGITEKIIKQMSIAGFISVQIGYESTSNNLLRKINKKNTFSSNLLFLKFANKYNIQVSGANIIRSLREETYEDVTEAIENLRFLRFFLGPFRHSIGNLGVMNSSRYFDQVKKRDDFQYNEIINFLPNNYLSGEVLSSCAIAEKICLVNKTTWNNFCLIENYYINNSYMYKIFSINELTIQYKEYLNGTIINEIDILKNSIDYHILMVSNKEVSSFEKIKTSLLKKKEFKLLTDCELLYVLEDLRQEGLIYSPHDFSEIIAIIDLDCII